MAGRRCTGRRAGHWRCSVAGFVALRVATNIGAQRFNFESAEFHAGVMNAIDRDREAILRAGGLVDGGASTTSLR